ncbi:MAG TPA: PQQ-binding-like beta-propeller repeat protein [Mycobacteriales bacterium]|nr:PQQ-binding-like beta-propeller repeat protein [Mycobacteriales bacterium]
MRRLIATAAAAVLLVGPALFAASGAPGGPGCRSADWPMYGHDLRHTFAAPAGCSRITTGNVATLLPAWFFHTKDSMTASPAVSHGMVYDGSWDGTFYAVDAQTGQLRWKFHITTTSPAAFGRIESSPAVVTAGSGADRRRVVIFGGGSRVWVLDALTGQELASIELDPRRPAARRAALANPRVVELESSPAVVPARHRSDRIYIGMDVHDEAHVGRTGLVALHLVPGRHWSLRPVWKYDVETNRVYRGRRGLTHGSGQGLGCGGVWSSPAVDVRRGLVYFGTASCDYAAQEKAAHETYVPQMVALHTSSGKPAWRFSPTRLLPESQRVANASTDADFGASPNLFKLPDGQLAVGEGNKDAKYYVRTAAHGRAVSTTVAGQAGLLNPNFAVGGFLGTTAVQSGPDGTADRIIGGTAIPIPHSLADLNKTTWFIRAIDPQRGTVDWVDRLAVPTYGASSVVNGVVFVPLTLASSVLALDAATGATLWIGPVIGPPSSTAVVAGDSVYIGTGTRETDLEYKAVSDTLQNLLKNTLGESPLSPISGIQAFRLARDVVTGSR